MALVTSAILLLLGGSALAMLGRQRLVIRAALVGTPRG